MEDQVVVYRTEWSRHMRGGVTPGARCSRTLKLGFETPTETVCHQGRTGGSVVSLVSDVLPSLGSRSGSCVQDTVVLTHERGEESHGGRGVLCSCDPNLNFLSSGVCDVMLGASPSVQFSFISLSQMGNLVADRITSHT